MWWLENPFVGLSLLEVLAVAAMLVVGVVVFLVARLTYAGKLGHDAALSDPDRPRACVRSGSL